MSSSAMLINRKIKEGFSRKFNRSFTNTDEFAAERRGERKNIAPNMITLNFAYLMKFISVRFMLHSRHLIAYANAVPH